MRKLFLLGALLACGAAHAAPDKPVRFTGATYGVGLFAGPTLLNHEALGGRVGWTTGVAARMTGMLHLSDAEFAYQVSRASPTAGGSEVGLWRQGFLFTIGLHPLFLLGLGNTRIPYALSAFHLDIGASLQVSTLSAGGVQKTRGDLGWHWGGGIALPLGDPNKGAAWWLGVRFRQVRANTELFIERFINVGEYQYLLTFERRWNWK